MCLKKSMTVFRLEALGDDTTLSCRPPSSGGTFSFASCAGCPWRFIMGSLIGMAFLPSFSSWPVLERPNLMMPADSYSRHSRATFKLDEGEKKQKEDDKCESRQSKPGDDRPVLEVAGRASRVDGPARAATSARNLHQMTRMYLLSG